MVPVSRIVSVLQAHFLVDEVELPLEGVHLAELVRRDVRFLQATLALQHF